jgi:hypothetical protein
MSSNFDEETVAALADAANERWTDQTLTDPKAKSWGFFAYGDAPAAIGGGVGAYCWFDSKAKLLQFVADVLPHSPPGPADSDPLLVADQVSEIISEVQRNNLDLEKARKRLNNVLRRYSQIEWIGTFKDLKDGKGTYARMIVKAFRRDRELTIGATPLSISRGQLADFKDFLSSYGI